MKIFVPGRICLFGEHSDWAGGYRRINADLEKKYSTQRHEDTKKIMYLKKVILVAL